VAYQRWAGGGRKTKSYRFSSIEVCDLDEDFCVCGSAVECFPVYCGNGRSRPIV